MAGRFVLVAGLAIGGFAGYLAYSYIGCPGGG
jgi:hypothetical protein